MRHQLARHRRRAQAAEGALMPRPVAFVSSDAFEGVITCSEPPMSLGFARSSEAIARELLSISRAALCPVVQGHARGTAYRYLESTHGGSPCS